MTFTVNIKSNLSIFGPPFGLLAIPMALAAIRETRERTMNPLTGEKEDVQDTWTTFEECFGCGRETEHQYLLWADERVVTSECTRCAAVIEHPDRIER